MLVMFGISSLELLSDRAILRTPSEPNYWGGNALIMRSAPRDANEIIAQFRHDFPSATHIKLFWDVSALDAGNVRQLFASTDLNVESYDVLTLGGPIKATALPNGLHFRSFHSDADWDATIALQYEIAAEEGNSDASYRRFVTQRNANRRWQMSQGIGHWFGVFDADKLVAHMGMYFDGTLARYQNVETQSSYRKRGICAALLAHVSGWAAKQAPQATQVIVAETGGAAGRLYRRTGFTQIETQIEAMKPAD